MKVSRLLITGLTLISVGCATSIADRKPAQTQPTQVILPRTISASKVPFLSHTGTGPFDNALALNVPPEQFKTARLVIENAIGRPLDFLKSWDPNGEAHVTVITPPEFTNILSKKLTMKEINDIANLNRIQSADLLILAIGSGKKVIAGNTEETFFAIVDSQKLRQIRNRIWELFVAKGGEPQAWDPTWFFPHITIGYTKQDIHEPDVFKNIKSSWDARFSLQVK